MAYRQANGHVIEIQDSCFAEVYYYSKINSKLIVGYYRI